MKKPKLERIFFRSWDLSEKSYKTYTDISFLFYRDNDDQYYYAEAPKTEPIKIGDINDLEGFLTAYSDDNK